MKSLFAKTSIRNRLIIKFGVKVPLGQNTRREFYTLKASECLMPDPNFLRGNLSKKRIENYFSIPINLPINHFEVDVFAENDSYLRFDIIGKISKFSSYSLDRINLRPDSGVILTIQNHDLSMTDVDAGIHEYQIETLLYDDKSVLVAVFKHLNFNGMGKIGSSIVPSNSLYTLECPVVLKLQ